MPRKSLIWKRCLPTTWPNTGTWSVLTVADKDWLAGDGSTPAKCSDVEKVPCGTTTYVRLQMVTAEW